MLASVVVSRSDELPADLEPLIRESLEDGHRFVQRLREQWSSGANRFERVGEAFFVARREGALAGVCGLNVDPYSSDPTLSRLRHLYVRRTLRRRGVGRALVLAALARAREHFVAVRLRSETREGDLFYRALGFSPAACADATHRLELPSGATQLAPQLARPPGGAGLGPRATDPLRGGCFCGAVRFELSEVFDCGYCHCSVCRRFSGAPAVIWANAPGRAFRVTAGRPAGFASSDRWVRYFCASCGAPVYGRHPSPPEDGSDLVSIHTPSLDDPEAVRPTAHIWCGSGLPYFRVEDGLPRFESGELTHPSRREGPSAEAGFPERIRRLPRFEGPFDAFRLAAEGCDVLFASYPAGTRIDWHAHDTENWGVVVQGELILTTQGSERRVATGQWYHLEPGQVHAARFEVDTAEVELWFRR